MIIIENIPQRRESKLHIPYDVAFVIGYFVSLFYGVILSSPRAGLLIALIIAASKEIHDQTFFHHYEWICTVSVMCGALVAYMFLNIFMIL